MNKEPPTRIEVADLITAHHPLTIVYRSLLVRQTRDSLQPAGNIILIGFEDTLAKAIQETLETPIDVLGELDKTDELNPSGLYVVKSPEADSAQAILGNCRQAPGAHPVNGIARIICVDQL